MPEGVSCVGEACLASCTDPTACVQTDVVEPENCGQDDAPPCLPRLPRCKEDGDPIECPGYDIRPFYDLSQPAELDGVSNDSYGRSNTEHGFNNSRRAAQ